MATLFYTDLTKGYLCRVQ